MKIAIIGAGNVGSALSEGWSKRGHDVTFGLRNPNDSKHAAIAKKATIADAAKTADVVVLATPWPATKDAVAAAGDLGGKVIIDCTNPVTPTLDGLEKIAEGSAGQAVAAWAKGAKVVKAFNTIGAPGMATADRFKAKPVMLIAGDDGAAKQTVASLASDLSFEPLDVGPLAMSASLEHVAITWIVLAIHRKQGVDFAFAITRR